MAMVMEPSVVFGGAGAAGPHAAAWHIATDQPQTMPEVVLTRAPAVTTARGAVSHLSAVREAANTEAIRPSLSRRVPSARESNASEGAEDFDAATAESAAAVPAPACDCDEDWLALRKRAGRLLESLKAIPRVCWDKKAWENEHEEVFALFRRGCLDSKGNGMLEAPIYSNRCIEDAWIFLTEISRRHPNRRAHIQECARALGTSYNWCLVLRGSQRVRAALEELPERLRAAVLCGAGAQAVLGLLSGAAGTQEVASSPGGAATAAEAAGGGCGPAWGSEVDEGQRRRAMEAEAAEAPAWRPHAAVTRSSSGGPTLSSQGAPGGGGGRAQQGTKMQADPGGWARWDAKASRPTPQVAGPGRPSRNPFRPAAEPAASGQGAFAAAPFARQGGFEGGGASTPPWPGGPGSPIKPQQLTNPFVVGPQVARETTNPFKARLRGSTPPRRNASVGSTGSSGGPVAGVGGWTSDSAWSRPALVSAC